MAVTATTPHSMLAEEIRAQAAALTGWNADFLAVAGAVGPLAVLPTDFVRVDFGDVTIEQADNESDLISYAFNVIMATSRDELVDAARFLDAQVRALKLVLADRASDRSPLRTDPLPLSSLDLPAGVVVFDVRIGTSTAGEIEGEGLFRYARTLEVVVVTYETRT